MTDIIGLQTFFLDHYFWDQENSKHVSASLGFFVKKDRLQDYIYLLSPFRFMYEKKKADML